MNQSQLGKNKISPLKSLAWYFISNNISELFHIFAVKTSGKNNAQARQQATMACEAEAISYEQFLMDINPNFKKLNFSEVENNLFLQALNKEKESPIKMGGGAHINLLYSLCKNLKPKNCLETGVAYGWSSLSILAALKEWQGELTSIDRPYPGLNNDKYVGIIVPEELRKNWTLLKTTDRKAIPKLSNRTFDMIHYDSDKSYQGRMFSFPYLYKMLKKNGFFISDDVNDNMGFFDFCNKNQINYKIIRFENKFLGVISK